MTCNSILRAVTRPLGLLLALLPALLLAGGCGEQRFTPPDAWVFTLPALEGDGTVTLADYRGEVVYLTFWASWCIPCREEMPHAAQLWRQHRDAGFQVIGVNVDEDPQAGRAFAREYGLPFPLAYDGSRSVSKQYRVAGYPTHYLIDRQGRIRFSAIGFNSDDALAVTQEVETLLRESADAGD